MKLVERLKQNIDTAKKRYAAEHDAAHAIVATAEKENREFTKAENEAFTKHREEKARIEASIKETEAQIASLSGHEAEGQALAAVEQPRAQLEDPGNPFPHRQVTTPGARNRDSYGYVTRLRNFQDKAKAYRFGMWAIAVMGRTLRNDRIGGIAQKATEFCKTNGIPLMVGTEGVNSDGGYLVPEEFSPEVIDLRESYGVLRRYAKVQPMGKELGNFPIRTGGLTAYAVGEDVAITESTKTWGQAKLVAQKLGVLTRMTSELSEDSLINMADDLVGEIAYAFAYSEDLAGFVGNGTSTYYGWLGLAGTAGKLLNPASFGQASLTIGNAAGQSNIASLYVGTGNAYSELILKDFQSVVGLLPQFADDMNAAWFVHRTFYFNVMLPLIQALSGGNTAGDLQNGNRTPMFLGYPVVFTQAMPKAEANSQVCALLGNLRMGAMLGDRRSNRIEFSQEATIGGVSLFERDEIGVKGTERVGFNFHSPGNYNTTAADRAPGPVCGLITYAS